MIIYDEIRKIKDEVVKLRQKKALALLTFVCAGLISLNYTKAYFADIEQSAGNVLQATTWDIWVQTTKADFEAGILTNADTTSYPDKVTLTGAYAVDDNTVGLWHLNEGSGVIASDETANDNDGAINGVTWVSGKYNSALGFDGVDDGVLVVDSSSLDITDAITIEAWVYQHANTGVQTVAEKNRSYYLNIQNGRLSFYWYGLSSPGYHKSPNVLPLGTWVHVAATYDGSAVKLYENGVEVYSAGVTGLGDNSTYNLNIGYQEHPSYPRWFNGFIDEVRISNIARDSFPVDYFDSGTIESQVFDAGDGSMRDWSKLDWDETLPSNTDVTLEVATSDNCSDWSTWQLASNDVINGIYLSSLSNSRSRCFKWKATLTRTGPDSTPILKEVRVLHFAP